MSTVPSPVWLPNSTVPYADQDNQDGNRGGGSPIDTPTNLTLVPDDSENLLHWEADFANVDTYEIRVNGGTVYSAISGGAYLDTAVTNGQAYSYELRGRKGLEVSSWTSAEAVSSAGKMMPTGTTYHIDPLGSDANTGLGTGAGSAFETINHALSIVTPGDGIAIAAGTYQEEAIPVGGKHNIPVSWLPVTAGTQANKIFIFAEPGDEGSVLLDGQLTSYGFFMSGGAERGNHYLFRDLNFQNCRSACIGNWDYIDPLRAEADMSTGIIIEDCDFDHTGSNYGQNVSHIAFWGSLGWVMRNNTLADCDEDTGAPDRSGSGMQSYQMQRSVIYHNTFDGTNQGTGILYKSYFTKTDDAAYHCGDIFLNKFIGGIDGIQAIVQGTGWPGNMFTCVNNNVFDSPSRYAINFTQTISEFGGQEIRIHNNTQYGANWSELYTGVWPVKRSGNLTISSTRDLVAQLQSTTKQTKINYSDYNIFDSSLAVDLDVNGSGVGGTPTAYTSLATWQAALSSATVTLDMDNPDPNSIQSDAATLFTNAATGDFTNKAGSPALGLMPDGSNAGAYQIGTEQIGAA